MCDNKTTLTFLISILFFYGTTVYAQKPPISETVTFINSKSPLEMSIHDRSGIPHNCTLVAVVEFVYPRDINILRSSKLNNIFAKIDTKREDNPSLVYARKIFSKKHSGVQIQIYGSDEEILKQQVLAMLDYLHKQEQEIQSKLNSELADIEARQHSMMQRSEALPEEIKQAKELNDKLSKETDCYTAHQAQNLLSEYKKILTIINIETVGVHAKLEALEGYEAGNKVSRQIKDKLFLLRLESEIELAGLMAKKDTILIKSKQLENFSKYHNSVIKLEKEQVLVQSELKSLSVNKFKAQRQIDSIESVELRNKKINIKSLKFIQ